MYKYVQVITKWCCMQRFVISEHHIQKIACEQHRGEVKKLNERIAYKHQTSTLSGSRSRSSGIASTSCLCSATAEIFFSLLSAVGLGLRTLPGAHSKYRGTSLCHYYKVLLSFYKITCTVAAIGKNSKGMDIKQIPQQKACL